MLYIMARDILGPRPAMLGSCGTGAETRTYRAIRKGLSDVSDFLVELETPRAALYLFPKVPSWLPGDSREAARTLLDGAKIATVPGVVFGPEGEGHLRFSFSVPEEMIAGGVEALREFASAGSSAGR